MDVRIEDKGACTFEVVEATELIDAARSLTQKRPLWVTTDPPGIGANQLIEWAVSEIEAARKASVDTDVSKHASSAVRFARQALNCQVDWYLKSWGFCFCKNAPGSADEKTQLLVRRGVIDELTANVVERAVRKRNAIEHEYTAAQLEEAEDNVGLMRRTVYHIDKEHEPSRGAWFFGSHFLRMNHTNKELTVSFGSWPKPSIVVNRFCEDPWLGIIEPESKFQSHVRRAFLRDTNICDYERMLNELSEMISESNSCYSEFVGGVLCEACGLNG